ncbi:hypothetical protein [Candidatus Sororendozoicomonas aggregata]|uniref:hypothetical protein n=1 Tax=Candidatus Sororendozoicomonas aggregata TaxID=3073239 RepID=UPI002ECFE2F9
MNNNNEEKVNELAEVIRDALSVLSEPLTDKQFDLINRAINRHEEILRKKEQFGNDWYGIMYPNDTLPKQKEQAGEGWY